MLRLAAAALAALAVPAAALAGGGPSPGTVAGGHGVAGAGVRYVAFPVAGRTLVQAVSRRDGRVLRWRLLAGSWAVPAVAFDGSTDGLSADGRTLVLAEPAGPQLRTPSRFALVDARSLRLRRAVALPGRFGFDALAPDASKLYAVEYVSVVGETRYRVRGFDLRADGPLGRGRVIADKRSGWTAMQGAPVTRATAAGGAWVYTLYAVPGRKPFVHALDTVHGGAVCIDLPWKGSDAALWRLRMRLSGDGSRLLLAPPGSKPRLAIDTSSLRVVA